MLETRYVAIAEKIEQKINDEHWTDRLPGVAVLGKELGANPRTVSKAIRVLSDSGKVIVRSTKGTFIVRRGTNSRQRYHTIGVLGLLQKDGNMTPVELADIEKEADGSGYHILAIDHSSSLARRSPFFWVDIPVDGFIFTNVSLTPEIIMTLRKAGISFVSTNRISDIGAVNWVDFDTERGMETVLRYLLKRGHRRIAYVSLHERLEEHSLRLKARYRKVMESVGAYDPLLYINDGNPYDYLERPEIYGAEMAGRLLSLEQPPTAISFCGTNIASGFYHRAQQMGFDIPGDLSIIATSQNPENADRDNFLTILLAPLRQRAKQVAQCMIKLIENPDSPIIQEFVPMDLLDRGSVGHAGNQSKS